MRDLTYTATQAMCCRMSCRSWKSAALCIFRLSIRIPGHLPRH